MLAKLLTGAFIVLVIGIVLLGISPAKETHGGTEVDPGVVLRVKGADVTGAIQPWQKAADASGRARAVVAKGTPLLPDAKIGGYAPDYTGLVGYAWQLPQTPELSDVNEWSDELRAHYAVQVPYEMLQEGDILANLRGGTYGQAILFDHWTDGEPWSDASDLNDRNWVRAQFIQGVPFVGEDVDRFALPPRAVVKTYTLQWMNGAITVRELYSTLQGPYYALRDNRIDGYVGTLNGIHVPSETAVAAQTTAHVLLVNRGGTPVTLQKVSAVAYGPNALQQGVAGATFLYPEASSVELKPGEIYDYNRAYSFQQPGMYLVLPRFQVSGIMYQPLEPAYLQVVNP